MRCLTYADLAPGKLTAKVNKVRKAIERDDLRSADIKKLANGPYFRAKLDDSSRLLVQFMRCGDQTVCLLLEVIRHHAYDKSRFLRGAKVDDEKVPTIDAPAAKDCGPMRFVHPTRPEFMLLDKPISLDDAQLAAVQQRPPMVLVGSAGSGKTALLLQRLRTAPGAVAYVTESRWLAETSRSLYVAFDGAPDEQDASFLSYQQLLETVHVPPGRPVVFRDFKTFFARHQQKLRFTSAHALFEELRGVLTAEPEGALDRDAYLALGVRQSLFDAQQRAVIYDVFERYGPWLAQNELYEPNLLAHTLLADVQPMYDFIAVDEVQDLTNAQLALVLASLKRSGQFILAGDANQIVHPNYFSWSKVKSLFWRGIGEVGARQVHMLTASYRNSPDVTAVANNVLRIKNHRFGSIDKESNRLMEAIDGPAGTVASFALRSPAVAELNKRTQQSTRVAVIVLRDEHKAEARRHFKTPLLFSIHEAKGLEYETIVLYRLLASERQVYADLVDGVTASDLQSVELSYSRPRDKTDKSSELYKFFVNALYVALTRAVRDVYLVEDDVGHPLLRLLEVVDAQHANRVESRRATAQEWQREAQRLQAQGKLDQADSIRRDVLKIKPVPWTVFDRAHLPDLMAKAIDPTNVQNKLRRQLLEFAYLHDEPATVAALEDAVGVGSLVTYSEDRLKATRAAISRCIGKGKSAILRDTERHGVDHRTQVGLTPLMFAAYTGDLALVEALCDRGADKTVRDHLGRQAIHWALRGAYDGSLQPPDRLGAVYDLVAPPSFDVDVDGRMVQIGREQGEYFVFQLIFARMSEVFDAQAGPALEMRASFLEDDAFKALPEVVLKTHRKKRTYLNHVLARACVGSTYSPCRQLWVRPRHGTYELNPDALLRTVDEQGEPVWRPIPEVLGLDWLKERNEQSRARQFARMYDRWRPFTEAQLAAAKVIAPGMSEYDLKILRISIDEPPPPGATGAEIKRIRSLQQAMDAIERGKIIPLRISRG